MKNIFKKTAGVMLVASMLCAMLATGCTASENSIVPENNKATESSTATENNKATENSTATESSANSEESKPDEEIELAQQTLVDEITGVQVTGMLPVGAELVSDTYFIDDSTFYDRFDFPYEVENDFPEITTYYSGDPERKVTNIAKIMNQEGWAQKEVTAGGKIVAPILIVKDSKVLKFESDLTITMPFNYRRGLVTGGKEGEPMVMRYNYDIREFEYVEVVPEEDTPKGMFVFKSKTLGRFFLGTEDELKSLEEFYTITL